MIPLRTQFGQMIVQIRHFVYAVALLAQKENQESIKFLMDTIINLNVVLIEQEKILIPQGEINFKILRTMFDGKMSSILSGAGGAHCQLCTASFADLKDLQLVRTGFTINRTISSAREIFSSVHTEEFSTCTRTII